MQQDLREKINALLLEKGFIVKNIERKCFDVLAKKDEILLVKTVKDANSVSKEFCDELRQIGEMLGVAPFIVAEKAGDELIDEVVYSRFGVYCLNLRTFENCLNRNFPLVMRNRAGFTLKIKENMLKNLREEKELSLNFLAGKLGVSREMIQRYESGNEMTLDRAEKIYNLFGDEIFEPINVFKINNRLIKSFNNEYVEKYNNLGFGATVLNKAPFDIVARKNEEIIFTEIGDSVKKQFFSISNLIDGDNLVIFKRKKPKDIPACTREEFLEFDKAGELLKFVKEF